MKSSSYIKKKKKQKQKDEQGTHPPLILKRRPVSQGKAFYGSNAWVGPCLHMHICFCVYIYIYISCW